VTDGIPDDALELLSPQSVAYWRSSETRFGDDFPPELEGFSSTVAEWRSSGMSELEIACAFARMLKLAHEEQLGLIERVTLDDGSAIIFERDPRRRLPLIGRRCVQVTVRGLAAGLCVIAIVAVLVFAFTNVLDAWMPNVATSALAIAVTITVVEQLIRREEQQRLQPRIQGSLNRLGRLINDFALMVWRDYVSTHERPDVDPAGDTIVLLDRWLADDEDLPRQLPDNGVPYLLTHAVDFARQAKLVADADREVLPPDLVAAIDELETTIRGAEQVHRLLSQFDVEQPEGERTALKLAVSAARTFASTYRRHGHPAWTRSP
jgi:hypothetical protein